MSPAMRWRVGTGMVVCLLVGAVAVTAASARPWLKFRVHFTALPYVGVSTNGPYTLFDTTVQGEVGVVLDELTGKRTTVWLPADCPEPDSDNLMLGGGWLLEDCTSSRVDLYSLAGNFWRPVPIAPSCVNFRQGPGSSCTPYAVGADWIDYDESSTRFGDQSVFQNIASGTLRRDPANRRTLADLSSPTLAHRVCPPLRVPAEGSMIGLRGRFVLAVNGRGVVVERCGSRFHLALPFLDGSLIDTWSASDARAIVEDGALPGVLNGIFVPSMQRFSVSARIPLRVRDASIELASDRHLYLLIPPTTATSQERVMWAPLPQSPS
jgi:hypothetical protein